MFGISWAELLVIVLVAVLVIPAKYWPDVAKFVAKCISFVRKLIWKISDASEQIKEQIELEKPITDLIQTTTEDVLSQFSTVRAGLKKIDKSKKVTSVPKKPQPKITKRKKV